MLSLTITATLFSFTSAQSIRGSQASLFAGTTGSPADTRIIGGSEARSNRFPYAVSIEDRMGHFCGGSLIAPDMILTAAHCQGGSYDVVIGRHDLNSNSGESIPMKRETPHPRYDASTTDADWMLILLDRPTRQDIPFIKLNSDKNTPNVGDDVTVMGWGDMTSDDYTQEFPDVLMTVDVNVISNNDCDASKGTINGWTDSYNGQITDNMLCAADKGQDSCQGDSGGPLVIQGKSSDGSDDVQIGVVSWGIGCASADFPGVYARLSEAYDWIVEEVCQQSSDPPAELCGGSSGGINDDNTHDDGGHDDYTTLPADDDNTLDDGGHDDYTSPPAADDDYSFDDDFGFDDDDDSTPPPSPSAAADDDSTDDFTYDDNTDVSIESVIAMPAQFNINGDSGSSTDGKWATIIEDDFNSDFGFFNSGGNHAKWMSEQKNRVGVLNIQNGKGASSSVYSNKIVETSYSIFRVVFSAYLLHMDDDDKFCLDISADGGSDWTEEKCWSTSDLSSKVWHDDIIAEFEADNASELMVRFRCQGDHNQDDVFIDKVAIQGLRS